MTAADVAVVLGGIALIALINWYFFFSDTSGDLERARRHRERE